MAHKKTWDIIIRKYGFQILKCRKDGKFVYFNFSVGYTNNPVNSFAKHQIYLSLNYPQEVRSIFQLKGINFRRTWGSKLDDYAKNLLEKTDAA